MKTKVSNISLRATKVLLHILISGGILEIIVLSFFGKIVAINPNLSDIFNYALAIMALLILLGMIFLPKEKKKTMSDSPVQKTDKIKEGRETEESQEITTRDIIFFFLGFLFGVFLILSLIIWWDSLSVFDKGFRIFSIFFIIFSPILITGVFNENTLDRSPFLIGTISCCYGGCIGLMFGVLILIIILLWIILSFLIKFISTWGFLWFVYF